MRNCLKLASLMLLLMSCTVKKNNAEIKASGNERNFNCRQVLDESNSHYVTIVRTEDTLKILEQSANARFAPKLYRLTATDTRPKEDLKYSCDNDGLSVKIYLSYVNVNGQLFQLAELEPSERAINIEVFGRDMSPDTAFNNKVIDRFRNVLVRETEVEGTEYLYANHNIKVVNFVGFGHEGGQKICVEAISSEQIVIIKANFDELLDAVPADTIYRVELIENCQF
jgi:hypothetical protein